MDKAKVTYQQILEELKLPPDLDKVKACKFCNEPLHMLKVNDFIVFWVHQGASIDKCASMNTFAPGKPVIAQNIHFFDKLVMSWNEVQTLLKKRKGEKRK